MLEPPFLQKWPDGSLTLANPSMYRDQGHPGGEFDGQKLEPFSEIFSLAV